MPKFYVLEQIRCAVTFVRQIEAANEEDALEMDCHVSGEAVGFHLGDTMGDTMEFFALPADPANLPQPFHPEALPLVPSAAPPVPSTAPADPVKAEMLAALKRLAEVIRDRHRLHGEDIGYALMSLKDAEAIIARAEGRA